MRTRRLKIYRWKGDAIMVYDKTMTGVNLHYSERFGFARSWVFSIYNLRKRLEDQ